MKGEKILYTADELAWIQANSTKPRRDAHREFVMLFSRDDISFENFKALCTRNGWLTGRTGCYEKGRTSENKGKICPEGIGGRHPNSRRTQFQKGQLPQNTKYLGHERISRDGYVEISIDEINPHTGFARRYVHKHRWLWEEINGPIPVGHFLKCLDGNRQNTDPCNWQCLPRGAQTYLNGRHGISYEAASPEVKSTIIAVARLRHARKSAKGKAGAA